MQQGKAGESSVERVGTSWAAVALFMILAAAAGCRSKPPQPKALPDRSAMLMVPPPAPPPPAGAPAPPDVAGAPADAEKSASGLAWKLLHEGTGTAHPKITDEVEVRYTGWTSAGKTFDSSGERPARLPLDGVMRGWLEGLPLMVAGEKRRFWMPPALAFGDPPVRPGAPAGTLVFDIELVGFTTPAAPPATPANLEKPPRQARRTSSGLAYQVLKKGTGKEHPRRDSVVEVHYSGWLASGKLFDSSVVRGQPGVIRVDNAIKGWIEGLQLMVPGEKVRLWVPAELGYGDGDGDGDEPGEEGGPSGPLVFDLELLSIRPHGS